MNKVPLWHLLITEKIHITLLILNSGLICTFASISVIFRKYAVLGIILNQETPKRCPR